VLDLVLVEPGVAVRIDEPQIGKPVVVERRQVAGLDDAAGVQNFPRLGSELNGEWQFRLSQCRRMSLAGGDFDGRQRARSGEFVTDAIRRICFGDAVADGQQG
jgi:hypothetical protein